jgi:D-alanyl-D-alanine carboxypeptidase
MIAEVAAEKEGEPATAPEATKPAGRPMPLGRFATADTLPVASISPTPVPRPRPAFVSGAPVSLDTIQAGTADTRSVAFDGSTPPTTSTTTPSMLRWVVGPAPAVKGEDAGNFVAKAEPQVLEPQSGTEIPGEEPQNSETRALADQPLPAPAHSGWMIQIGATDDVTKASDLLARAKAQGPRTLGDAQPFTEKVQKGDATLYRARFAGLDADDAQAACRSLRRSGFACFATKN